jgi:dolichol-phosphate mannosyltransferase
MTTAADPLSASAALARASRPVLSLVTPAFCEAENLPHLYDEIARVLDPLGISWEWLIVDDHSPDATYDAILRLSSRDPRVRGIRLARNHGSHKATRCGIANAAGESIAILAADLQDPPAILPVLLSTWNTGTDVVWAVRRGREGETRSTIAFARLYYWIMRNVAGMKQMPPTGADFVLFDRRVADALLSFREQNTNLYALIAWMGFTQGSIEYDKQPRLHGHSGWTLRKKLTLVVDSLTSFTFAPIRVMSCVGFVSTLLALIWAAVILRNVFYGHPVEGWSSVMLAILLFGGLQMIMLGVLGEYLWRALDESRGRPQHIVERQTFTAANERRSS